MHHIIMGFAQFGSFKHVPIHVFMVANVSSIDAPLAPMTPRRLIQDGGPHDVRSKMATIGTTTTFNDSLTCLVTPQHVSQCPIP